MAATILEELATTLSEPIPQSKKELKSFIKRSLKKASLVDKWNKLSPEAQNYLLDVEQAGQDELLIPDGFDDGESTEEEPAPESFQCDVVPKTVSIGHLLERMSSNTVKFPDFQRKFNTWNLTVKQAFLRSVFSGVPITGVMMACEPNGNHDRYVLDGMQRISTLKDFHDGKISLGRDPRGSKPTGLAGKKFSALPRNLKNDFLFKEITTVELKAEEKFWPYIFRQINKGGKPLNEHEVRRATPWGPNHTQHPLILCIDEFAENHQQWLQTFGRNMRFAGMGALLRAVAMHFDYKKYQKPMVQFVDNFCESLREGRMFDTDKIAADLDLITEALFLQYGRDAFRLPKEEGDSKGKPVNLGLVDCLIHAGLLLLEKREFSGPKELGSTLALIRDELLGCNLRSTLKHDTSGKESVHARLGFIDSKVNDLVKTE